MEVALFLVASVLIVWMVWGFAYEQGKTDGWNEGFNEAITLAIRAAEEMIERNGR